MKPPRIGQAVRGSRTGRPIMVVLDLLGRRTALRVIWELRDEPLTFRALQQACESNARLLNTRLAELKASGVVEHRDGGYRLTREGRELTAALAPLTRWAQQWAKRAPASARAAEALVK